MMSTRRGRSAIGRCLPLSYRLGCNDCSIIAIFIPISSRVVMAQDPCEDTMRKEAKSDEGARRESSELQRMTEERIKDSRYCGPVNSPIM